MSKAARARKRKLTVSVTQAEVSTLRVLAAEDIRSISSMVGWLALAEQKRRKQRAPEGGLSAGQGA